MSAFRQALLTWFAANKRDLPWRRSRDPYSIWVSEVMLQQTQVATVIPYFLRFMERYPDVRALAAAPLEDVLKLWENLGYYARARNLHRAARAIAGGSGGVVPRDHAGLRSLPGVGDYIASAVASIAYSEPRAAADGNVKRVLARLFLIDAPPGSAASARAYRERAEETLDRSDPGEFNQAMMELGALVCTPRNPACGACPVAGHCRAFEGSLQAAYPPRAKRRATPRYRIAVGVVRKGERFLITRREETGLLGGLWELPGGKIEPGESPEAACAREIAEEVSLSVDVKDRVARVSHAYSHFSVVVDVFECEYTAGQVSLNGPIDHRWILLEDKDRYAFPALNHKIFPHLARRGAPGRRQRVDSMRRIRAPRARRPRRGENRLKNPLRD